jgi:hypothetical protein
VNPGPGSRPPQGLEARAVAPGAAVAILAIVAAVLIGRVSGTASSGDRAYLVLPLVELGLAGLLTGGWLAALRCRGAPLAHGTAAALIALGACTATSVVSRLAGGGATPWAGVTVWLLLAVAATTAARLACGPREADSPG